MCRGRDSCTSQRVRQPLSGEQHQSLRHKNLTQNASGEPKTHREPRATASVPVVFGEDLAPTLRRFLFQVFDEQCLGPFSVFSEQWKHTGGTHCSTQPEKKCQRFMCGALVGIHTPSHVPQWSRDLLQQCQLVEHCESINQLTEPERNPSR